MYKLEKPRERIINLEIIKKYWEEHLNCELCGDKFTDSPHHIKFKSRGGDDLPANLITLCNSFSENKHHMCSHNQFQPFLSEEYLYTKKGVCSCYPNEKINGCPTIMDSELNWNICKWFGKCRFTYDEEYQKQYKMLKEKENEEKRKEIQKDYPF